MNQCNALWTTMTTTSLLQPPATSSQIHIISWNLCSNTAYVTVSHADECFEYHISRVIVHFTTKMFSHGQNTRNANPLRELLSTKDNKMLIIRVNSHCTAYHKCYDEIFSFPYCTSYQSSRIWKVNGAHLLWSQLPVQSLWDASTTKKLVTTRRL